MYNNKLGYISSELSKTILNQIIKKQKINYKKYKINHLKKSIQKIKNDYLKLEKQREKINPEYKYYIFWEIIKNNFKNVEFKLIKRNQKKKEDKLHILFSELNKSLGFTPSLLFLLINSNQIKKYLQVNIIYKKIKEVAEIEEINNAEKIQLLDMLLKKNINIITPLCPDYEHIKIGNGLYKYTFNKLGDGLGLIGKRLISILNNLHKILEENDIKFRHILLYGDFESYSSKICERLKINEKEFKSKLSKSIRCMKEKSNKKCTVDLVVNYLSNRKSWEKRCSKNEKTISIKAKNNTKFNKLIEDIANSRSMLYSSWFPEYNRRQHKNLVIQQGAEYASMGDLFSKKIKNPIVLGLDHPKMKNFYKLNNEISVIYGKPRYI